MFNIKNLTVKIKDKTILNNLSFQINKGELVGLVGKNGAGKTTLFNSIYKRYNFNGEILLNESPIIRNMIAYIESENSFYPSLTCSEFISFIDYQNVSPYKELLLETFNLPTDTYIENLSTGEKKKLGIISNLLFERELYIFDEPFNGLDMEGVEILKLLLKGKLFQNKYLILSSHILDSMTSICDKIIYLNNGIIEKEFNNSDFQLIQELYNYDLKQKVEKIEISRNIRT